MGAVDNGNTESNANEAKTVYRTVARESADSRTRNRRLDRARDTANNSSNATATNPASGNADEFETETTGFQAFQVAVEESPKRAIPKTERARNTQAASDMAGFATAMLDGVAVTMLGPDAKLNMMEHSLIDAPLNRILARMTPEDAEKMGHLIDPIMLGCGLFFWGMRVWSLKPKPRAIVPRDELISASGGMEPKMSTVPNGTTSDIAPPSEKIQSLLSEGRIGNGIAQ